MIYKTKSQFEEFFILKKCTFYPLCYHNEYSFFFLLQALKFCNVVYKRFDFDKYPPHVRNLKNYAFKPLIIQVSEKY